jgi:bidirectional [NiFe] hydrogenase diaphorase subunit
MHRLLERITNGSATMQDLDTLKELCVMVKETSLCGLGQSAPNPVSSTIHYFLNEYEAHIRNHHCPAGVCTLDQAPVTELVHA